MSRVSNILLSCFKMSGNLLHLEWETLNWTKTEEYICLETESGYVVIGEKEKELYLKARDFEHNVVLVSKVNRCKQICG